MTVDVDLVTAFHGALCFKAADEITLADKDAEEVVQSQLESKLLLHGILFLSRDVHE